MLLTFCKGDECYSCPVEIEYLHILDLAGVCKKANSLTSQEQKIQLQKATELMVHPALFSLDFKFKHGTETTLIALVDSIDVD